MAKKRANGEGTITRLPNGRYLARYYDRDGRRRTLRGRSHPEVRRLLRDALDARDAGRPATAQTMTLKEFLDDLLDAIKPEIRPSTWASYESYMRLHINPALGGVRLAELGPRDLERLYAGKLAEGLAPRSVHHVHAFLHRALRQAQRWGLVTQNVASLARPPRISKHRMRTLTPDEVHRLFDALEDDRLRAFYVVAITTGARLGELLALHWPDVDLDRHALSIRGTLTRGDQGLHVTETKTGRERRIMLTATATTALQQHRARQVAERLRAGTLWTDNNFVFTNEVGLPVDPSNLRNRSFRPALERAGLPHMRLHDLRHSAATLLLGEGVHPKVVSEMLGHSQISITLDLYSHVTPTMQAEAVRALDGILGTS